MSTKSFHGILMGAGAAAMALMLWASGILDLWEFATWRWRVELFSKPSATTERIKLILVDQNSLAWGEKENAWSWPWPREVYTVIIDYCVRSGAKAVVFDLLFTESSLYGVEDDRRLAAAIDRAPFFVLPLPLGRQSGETLAWPPQVPQRFPITLDNLDAWLTPASRKELVMPRATFPGLDISSSSAILGGVLQDPDFDGIFRRCHLFHLFDGRVIPSVSLAAFLAPTMPYTRAPRELSLREGALRMGDRSFPLDSSGKVILRFRGPAGAFTGYSAASVIQSELRLREGKEPVIKDNEVFRDCTVFLGSSAPGLLDLRPTPVSRVYPGVELHATMLDNLMSQDFLQDIPLWVSILAVLVLAFLSSFLVVLTQKTWQGALTVVILLPIPAIFGFAAYPLGYWWPIVFHEAAVVFSLGGGIFLNYAHEGRQKAFIKKAFKHYLSPAVIEKILEDPSQLKLGGERRELSILFSDLQGFSSISERLDPQALTMLLNDYLSDMTDIILEEGGTLDKYEGDAIIAFWNAPISQPDHAARACRAAIRCQLKLQERREEYLQRTGAHLYARIGINTGHVVVGNMGSKKRFDYTVLGDAANLASRLEGANKVFGTFTMVSEATWFQTANEFLGREIGLLRVVGRKTPVRVYELLGLSGSESSPELESFGTALALYYDRDWSGALELFSTLPDDPVAGVYTSQCRNLLHNPELPWDDGVWNLKEK